ncbi:LamB/YcsF family protein [Nautilia profundicola AmH]|uniref:LamB/YcsF family protein n=1 Tax=Nautilia profundicola (strain ATCC BAA-1463 / DSM 18972 / AmH) TaxID=598659 RepID=B9L7F1_NAUPA|nr:5-oxoprolinase subunit PxpA [Nautilia profundicola]ACM92433.1 LamB/YcsF family protein [Nautilia profundicola AmH]
MIKLNADLGESFGHYRLGMDEEIMPLIDMANIACGFHAGDPIIMDKTVLLAKNSGVEIGAHPGYPDLLGFGRRSMKCSAMEIENYIIYQAGALDAFCKKHKTDIKYIKPHGALYNDMMGDAEVFRAVLNAAAGLNLPVMILSSSKNEEYEKIAHEFGVKLIYEVFADRNYTDEGFLVPRTRENAVISDKNEILERVLMFKEGYILSENKKVLNLKVDTICVHGDNEKALEIIKAVREVL